VIAKLLAVVDVVSDGDSPVRTKNVSVGPCFNVPGAGTAAPTIPLKVVSVVASKIGNGK